MFNIPVREEVGVYLGMDLNFAKKKSQLFGQIQNKISGQISGFKSSSLSAMGRVILAKHTLSSIAQYTLSMLGLPVMVARQIDKDIAKFIWQTDKKGRGIDWKFWDSICKSKFVGGLGLRSTALLNQTFLGKIAWEILKDRQSLVGRFVLSKYCQNTHFLQVKPGSAASWN